jgi:hypothetical protein
LSASSYIQLRKSAKKDLRGDDTTRVLAELISESLHVLAGSKTTQLKSEVREKTYFAFSRLNKLSRPLRSDLWDVELATRTIEPFVTGTYGKIPTNELDKILYTMAMSFCCATDLQKQGDKKTPATFFECFVGNIFARELGVNPRTQVDVLNLDMKATLPTDFLFDLGAEKCRIHLPVKLSTRERVVQVWAHQRVLDGVYGVGRFRGILVVATETKAGTESLKVTEICLPDQWAVYQMFISQLRRIYYLDVPARYSALPRVFPYIQVKPLSAFFAEKKKLISPAAE